MKGVRYALMTAIKLTHDYKKSPFQGLMDKYFDGRAALNAILYSWNDPVWDYIYQIRIDEKLKG